MKKVDIKLTPIDNIDNVEATLSITWTIAEWQSFLKQCTAGKGFWDREALGNIYLLEFGEAIKKILMEAEKRYQLKHDEIHESNIVLDAVLHSFESPLDNENSAEE